MESNHVIGGYMAIDTLSNAKRIEKIQALTGNSTDKKLSDQNMRRFGTNRKSELMGKIGNTGVPFERLYNDAISSVETPEFINTSLFGDASLVSYWRLEGNSNDSKGSNDGTDTNMTYGLAYGKYDQGGLFNGTTSKFSRADNASLSITGDLSIALWVNIQVLPADAGFETFLSKAVSGARSYYFLITNASGTYKLVVGISGDGSTDPTETVDWAPSLDTWYHIAFVYDALAGSVDFYVNGTQQGIQQTGLPTSIFDSDTKLQVGKWPDDVNYPFNGYMDDIVLFNRVLTAQEVAGIYDGTA